MKTSYYLGKLFNIKVLVHISFVLIFLYVGYYSYNAFHNMGEVLWDCLITLLAFCCVLLHEFGHALAARRIGIETRQILILPIGGMAQLDSMPEKPRQELFVTICGPLVNLGIVALLLPFAWYFGGLPRVLTLISEGANEAVITNTIRDNLFTALAFINIFLFIFNLIPAFPMDGGRIFRAILASFLKYKNATLIAVRMGQAIAVSAVLYFIADAVQDPKQDMFSIIKMVVLGIFIVILAGMEYRMVKERDRRGYYEGHEGAGYLSENDTLADAINHLESSRQDAIQVMGPTQEQGLVIKNLPGHQHIEGNNSHTYRFRPGDSLGHTLAMMRLLNIAVLPLPDTQGYYLIRNGFYTQNPSHN